MDKPDIMDRIRHIAKPKHQAVLSKSRYTSFCQCPKKLWLKVHNPEEEKLSADTVRRMEEGNVVGDTAMELLGDFVEVTSHKDDGTLDLSRMCSLTAHHIAIGTENICEASFSFDGNYCAVDILHKVEGGYEIYEVKSSTWSEDNLKDGKYEKYYPDLAYQKWVLRKCGVNVTGAYLVLLDKEYKREAGPLDQNGLFHILDASGLIEDEYSKVDERVPEAKKMVLQSEEPETVIGVHCHNPYACPFWDYCRKCVKMPEHSVFDIYRIGFPKAVGLYNEEKKSFDDIRDRYRYSDGTVGRIQKIQVECTLDGREHIDRDGIRDFLKSLSYPLYFLDFETYKPGHSRICRDAHRRADSFPVFSSL